jgi:hypothetical protein
MFRGHGSMIVGVNGGGDSVLQEPSSHVSKWTWAQYTVIREDERARRLEVKVNSLEVASNKRKYPTHPSVAAV